MFNHNVENFVRKFYDLEAGIYRNDTDPFVLTDQGVMTHTRDLSELCMGFKKKIDVLDLCCGTGRYFHALKDVKLCVGLDFSLEMLKQALSPVNKEQLDIQSVQLIASDAQTIDKVFKSTVKFDFIYSIGALGEYTSFNLKLLDSIYNLLADGGGVYLTTVKRPYTMKIRMMKVLRKFREIVGVMDRNLIFTKYALSEEELLGLLKQSKFSDYKLKEVSHKTNTHIVVMATK